MELRESPPFHTRLFLAFHTQVIFSACTLYLEPVRELTTCDRPSLYTCYSHQHVPTTVARQRDVTVSGRRSYELCAQSRCPCPCRGWLSRTGPLPPVTKREASEAARGRLSGGGGGRNVRVIGWSARSGVSGRRLVAAGTGARQERRMTAVGWTRLGPPGRRECQGERRCSTNRSDWPGRSEHEAGARARGRSCVR